jgi:ArsR family transcriptional regulator
LTKPRRTRPAGIPTVHLTVTERTIKGLTEMFDLLSDESRLKILLALAQHGEMHVSALCDLLGRQSSQPAVSHHLRLLRDRNLVGFRRDGKHNYYRLDSALVRDLIESFFSDSGNGHKQLNFEDFSLAFKRK